MAHTRVLLGDLQAAAKSVLTQLRPKKEGATLITLSGELGAGKTTFVQTLAREMGVTETVQSPTYVLMKKYKTAHPEFETLIHIDAYRLNGKKEFAALKPESFLSDQKTLICVEWPERVEGALPQADRTLLFSSEAAGEGERYIDGIYA